jgi:hypothetical protein
MPWNHDFTVQFNTPEIKDHDGTMVTHAALRGKQSGGQNGDQNPKMASSEVMYAIGIDFSVLP